MNRLRLLVLAAALSLLAACLAHGGGSGKRFALLVGCTVYPKSEIRELWGPANDVPLWAKLLDKFGFAQDNIRILLGWPDDKKRRPTYANIKAAWEELIAKADADTQIFILLSGHGMQVPIPDSQIDPLDPRNPEPDGLDEAFLPADVEKAQGDRPFTNLLLDDQIGAWLDQFRAKGASVWVVFDCCHSGTMERGDDELERPREVLPQELGISEEALKKASLRAKKAVEAALQKGERERGLGTVETSALGLQAKQGKGSVVAFYAAQSFETAPELPRPIDAPRAREHYYGLLSYSLVKTLEQHGAAMSYRQLSQLLAANYSAERGARPPTPFAEGDLDYEVLGVRQWPKGGDILLKKDDSLQVNAGELRGLTVGSILSVHPAVGNKGTQTLGYLKVTAVTPVSASVAPCLDPANGKPAAKADALPDLAVCKLHTRDFGDMRLKLALRSASDADAKLVPAVEGALGKMSEEVRALCQVVKDEPEAQFLLWIAEGSVYLKAGAGQRTDAKASAEVAKKLVGKGLPPRLFAGHAVADKALSQKLERSLQTLFTWQNIWRVGGTLANRASGAEVGLKLVMEKLEGKDTPAGEFVNGQPVVGGQRVRFKLVNGGSSNLWITLLFMNGDFGINTRALNLKAGAETKWFAGTINARTSGKEGIVVLAVSMDVSREAPDFSFLEQAGLKAKTYVPLGEKLRDALERKLPTPFQQLLQAAALGQGQRAFEEDPVTAPTILTWSWVTLPAGD